MLPSPFTPPTLAPTVFTILLSMSIFAILLAMSVSPLLTCKWVHQYHLSRFHIYELTCDICFF